MTKRKLVTLRAVLDSLIMLVALYAYTQDEVLKSCFMFLFIIASHSCTDQFMKYLPKEGKQVIGKLDAKHIEDKK